MKKFHLAILLTAAFCLLSCNSSEKPGPDTQKYDNWMGHFSIVKDGEQYACSFNVVPASTVDEQFVGQSWTVQQYSADTECVHDDAYVGGGLMCYIKDRNTLTERMIPDEPGIDDTYTDFSWSYDETTGTAIIGESACFLCHVDDKNAILVSKEPLFYEGRALWNCFYLTKTDYETFSSSMYPNLGGNANCFIVKKGDKCTFKTTRVDTAIASARLVWESEPGMISGIENTEWNISFKAEKNGNALIAACDQAGNILWSWHIWCPSAEVATVPTKTGYQLMNMNLGAMDNTPGSASSYGMLYQWGRKDPFPASPTATGDTKTVGVVYGPDGNQLAISAGSYTQKDGTIAASIANPTTVYSNYSTYGKNMDWLAVSDTTLWSSRGKTIYDPCPKGYRVPGKDVFMSFTTTGGYTTNPADFDIAAGSTWEGGWTFNMADGSLYFPAAARYDGTYAMLYGSVSGLWGSYWGAATGSQEDFGACILAFQQSSVSAMASASKADAYSIRCVKEY